MRSSSERPRLLQKTLSVFDWGQAVFDVLIFKCDQCSRIMLHFQFVKQRPINLNLVVLINKNSGFSGAAYEKIKHFTCSLTYDQRFLFVASPFAVHENKNKNVWVTEGFFACCRPAENYLRIYSLFRVTVSAPMRALRSWANVVFRNRGVCGQAFPSPLLPWLPPIFVLLSPRPFSIMLAFFSAFFGKTSIFFLFFSSKRIANIFCHFSWLWSRFQHSEG